MTLYYSRSNPSTSLSEVTRCLSRGQFAHREIGFGGLVFEEVAADVTEAIRLALDERKHLLHRGYALEALERKTETQRVG